jgi:hypothetical protein
MLSQEEYGALRQLDLPQLEELLFSIRKNRWAQFRDDQRGLLWVTGVALVSALLSPIAHFFGFIAFCGWVCAMSLGFSAFSRSSAIGRECDYFRRSHRLATQSSTYDTFCEAYCRTVATFQILQRTTFRYAIEASCNPALVRHAAEMTFYQLGWPIEWSQNNELVYYPEGHIAQRPAGADAIGIRYYATNKPHASLLRISAYLKFNSKTKDKQEQRLKLFDEAFQEEFKKLKFLVLDANEDHVLNGCRDGGLSPYWGRTESGTFALQFQSDTKTVSAQPI